VLKRAIDGCATVLVAPSAGMCLLEARRGRSYEAMFCFWAQVFAVVPGLPGVFLRRAFYRLTLDACATSFFVGFGALFSHRCAIVEEDVYIGPYAVVGSARLRRGALLGTRASILSGAALHQLDAEGRWSPANLEQLQQVDIGEHAWIGEASLVMADVGRSSLVAAGSVVSSRVPPGVVVAGNPARFVRHLPIGIEKSHERDTATLSVR
jgi:acetyltransferase-like isoleucine patch superfamily enzyme